MGQTKYVTRPISKVYQNRTDYQKLIISGILKICKQVEKMM
jgi:hypothetical protein